MKNNVSRLLALIVALLVLCAPIGAMAEEAPSVTLALSNFSLSIGEDVNLNVDATTRFDVTADMETGSLAGTLTVLAGSDKAIKGGFTFDMGTMNLVAALEGVTDAVLVPMGDMVEQVRAQFGEMLSDEQMAKLMNVFNAYMNLMNVASEKGDVMAAAVSEKLNAWLANVVTNGNKGETTVTVRDSELPAVQYDYELTVQEIAAIGADLYNAVKNDPELLAAVQNYADALLALSGEESMDISAFDADALVAQLEGVDAKIAGSLYLVGETSFVLDLNLIATEYDETVTVPTRTIVMVGESDVYASFSIDADVEGEVVNLSMETTIPTDGTPKFSFVVTGVQGEDDTTQNILFSLEGDFSDGASLTLYAETESSYTYGENTYNSLMAFGVNYTGSMTTDESGITCPGKLVLYFNQDGTEITFGCDTLASLNSASTVDFDMPNNRINITEADEDTMNALAQEYMGALSNGLMILMSAPGVQDLMTMFN